MSTGFLYIYWISLLLPGWGHFKNILYGLSDTDLLCAAISQDKSVFKIIQYTVTYSKMEVEALDYYAECLVEYLQI